MTVTDLLADVAAVLLGAQAGTALVLAVRPSFDLWLAAYLLAPA